MPKMKINAKIRGEWILIPSKSNKNTVGWLGKECLSRYRTVKSYTDEDSVIEVRKSQGGSLLFPDDLLVDILEDNDFVHVGECANNINNNNT